MGKPKSHPRGLPAAAFTVSDALMTREGHRRRPWLTVLLPRSLPLPTLLSSFSLSSASGTERGSGRGINSVRGAIVLLHRRWQVRCRVFGCTGSASLNKLAAASRFSTGGLLQGQVALERRSR